MSGVRAPGDLSLAQAGAGIERFPQLGKYPTTYSRFAVDVAIALAQNPTTIQGQRLIRAQRRQACAICRDGLCSASIRNARLVDIGYAPMLRRRTIAAIVASRCTTFRRRSVRNLG